MSISTELPVPKPPHNMIPSDDESADDEVHKEIFAGENYIWVFLMQSTVQNHVSTFLK